MTASDIAAWWGAALATIIFGWDIYKWKTSGARLVVRVKPGMQEAGDREEQKHIYVEVINRGDRMTTLTHLAVYEYASKLDRMRKKAKTTLLVPRPSGGPGLPYELEPGKRWTGLMDQANLIAKLETPADQTAYLDAIIVHSGSNRDVRAPFAITRDGKTKVT